MNQLSDRRVFGLLGAVVDGNPTEEMMQAAFGAAGLPWKYVSLAIPQGSFAEAVRSARQLGFAGLHITKPYKIDAVPLMDRLTTAAAKIGAVNCVDLAGGVLVGDNTDGRGLVNAVSSACRLAGASVTILGAGGAARAVAVELALAGAREIVIVNRSAPAGASLVEAIQAETAAVARLDPWAAAYPLSPSADLVVNATSVGMADPDERPDVDMSLLRPGTVVADAVIAGRPTAFLVQASERGLATVAGVEMLVKQAAISFQTWTGKGPDERVLRRALDASLFDAVAQAPRNRFEGVVASVRMDTVAALVEVHAGPYRLVSMASRDHVDELGLVSGMKVVCGVKATDVTVDIAG
jgi:shikimate dehydrogenase